MKIVYGNFYFALEAVEEVPANIKELYKKALVMLKEHFSYNLIKVSRDLNSVTLAWYPDLDTHSHPYLEKSVLITLGDVPKIKYKKESEENPVILHRIETMLSKDNKRLNYLIDLTKKEEDIGLFDKEHLMYIGRRKYWNDLCARKNMHESISPVKLQFIQDSFLTEVEKSNKVSVRRELTAMGGTRGSSPTKWALKNNYIKAPIFDWGCGRGRDVEFLKNNGLEVEAYDPYYKKSPSPEEVNFEGVNTILLNYVLNVIEADSERKEVLNKIKALAKPGTTLIVSARSNVEIDEKADEGSWKIFNDGYITSRNTFQKGFNKEELHAFCEAFGTVKICKAISGGIVCVMTIGI